MIKFFRKIRHQLLSENKTSKYFKYAIGEIILVVIGILIALQVNNWNNNKQLEEVQIKYLNEIELIKNKGAIAGQQLGKPINFQALKNDIEFKNAIILNEDMRVYMLENYRALEKNSIECMALINSELKK
ncbi:DUF6090 family protein [uncultured Polaribacter sp.]|uniref:DUF6090 family protein n=1 Tax=uncultured Polaribacter sp. TaxID=174711 RepID=UPI0030DA569B|tara:strand:- start:1291 stop:1680 length:390 start_codon:yes stop_codon:yes gene_type:complete